MNASSNPLSGSRFNYETIAEAIPSIVFVTQQSGNVYTNRAFQAYTGRSFEQLLGHQWVEIVHPDDRAHVLEQWNTATGTQQRYELRFRLRAYDGSFRWHIVRALPMRDDAGQSTGTWFGTASDIDDLTQAEWMVRTSEAQLQRVVAQAPVALCIFRGNDLVCELANPRYGALLPGRQLVGRRLRDAVPEAPEAMLEKIRDVAQTGRPYYDAQVYLPLDHDGDGIAESERWFSISSEALLGENGRPDGVITALADVTQQALALRSVSETESRFREVADAAPVLIWVADASMRLEWCNRMWLELRQCTLADELGDGWRRGLHPDDAPVCLAAYDRAGQTREAFSLELRMHRQQTGEFRWLLNSATPRYAGDGTFLGFIGSCIDITDRKLAEQALIRSEKLAAAGRLAATVAHEINNPLEGAVNLLYLAKDRVSDPEAKAYLSLADAELARVTHIVRQSLGFYRERGTPQLFSLSQVAIEVVDLYTRRAIAAGIRIEQSVTRGLLVEGSMGEIRQILSNLVSNAIDATGHGGCIQIRIRMLANGFARITVFDNGTGIPIANRAQIFEPFFTTKQEFGTGLGLWVSRQLVEKHGGRIRVSSRCQPGRSGTIFSLMLPAISLEDSAKSSEDTEQMAL